MLFDDDDQAVDPIASHEHHHNGHSKKRDEEAIIFYGGLAVAVIAGAGGYWFLDSIGKQRQAMLAQQAEAQRIQRDRQMAAEYERQRQMQQHEHAQPQQRQQGPASFYVEAPAAPPDTPENDDRTLSEYHYVNEGSRDMNENMQNTLKDSMPPPKKERGVYEPDMSDTGMMFGIPSVT